MGKCFFSSWLISVSVLVSVVFLIISGGVRISRLLCVVSEMFLFIVLCSSVFSVVGDCG